MENYISRYCQFLPLSNKASANFGKLFFNFGVEAGLIIQCVSKPVD